MKNLLQERTTILNVRGRAMSTSLSYITLGGGYSYAAPTCGGVVLRNPNNKEVYFQPGDHEQVIRDTIDALSECDEDLVDIVAQIAFSEYFD